MILLLITRICLILATTQPAESVTWMKATDLTMEGRGWVDPASPYVRLPAKMQAIVRPQLWEMSRHSAGIAVRFVTTSNMLQLRWKLTGSELQMVHMPATAASGLDLYVRDSKGAWQFAHNFRPAGIETTAGCELGNGKGEAREYRLYLPLYNGVESLELTAPVALQPTKTDPARKAIVVYGTSIDQGACASRPGMTWPSIVGRKLDREVINLGFSGNGRLDPPIAELMAELDPAAFVLTPLWNVNYEEGNTIIERSLKFIQIIRAARRDTPIVMVGESNIRPELHPTPATIAFKKVFDQLVTAGDHHLYWIDGKELFGDDGEGTVDEIHPSDLGMYRQAMIITDVLRKILP